MGNQEAKSEALICGAELNAGLDRMIDGDVTCWGIDDVVAYGIKVAEMERDACATIVFLTRLKSEADDATDHGMSNWLIDLEGDIRKRSNVELRGRAL